jgi:hypothetical protein
MHPFRFDGIEPRTFTGQLTDHHADQTPPAPCLPQRVLKLRLGGLLPHKAG